SADVGQSQRSLPVVQGIPDEFVLVNYRTAFDEAMLSKGKRSMRDLALVLGADFLLRTAFLCPGNHVIGLMAELRSDRPMQGPCFSGREMQFAITRLMRNAFGSFRTG